MSNKFLEFPERWLLRETRLIIIYFKLWPLGDRRGAYYSNNISPTEFVEIYFVYIYN